MGKLVMTIAVTVNGAFTSPAPDTWLEVDNDSADASLEQFVLADAMVLGRKTYEALAADWPRLTDDPALGRYAERMNTMPKYVASRTLSDPLDWNATLIEDDVYRAVPRLKERHGGNIILSGCGELAYTFTRQGLIDEFWFWVNPYLWATGPRIFDGVGPIRLQLAAATPYRSGVLWLRYRPATG